jgi:hypothetical protein
VQYVRRSRIISKKYLEISQKKTVFLYASGNLLIFISRSRINQTETTQFDRVLDALPKYVKIKKLLTFVNIQRT